MAVGDEANALGKKSILDVDRLQADRPLFARDFGETGQLIDQITLGHPPHGEGEPGLQRQTVENRGKRKADQCGRERTTENQGERMAVEEHALQGLPPPDPRRSGLRRGKG